MVQVQGELSPDIKDVIWGLSATTLIAMQLSTSVVQALGEIDTRSVAVG